MNKNIEIINEAERNKFIIKQIEKKSFAYIYINSPE